MDASLEGGCLCGAVRYRVHGAPGTVAHCHCKHCRGATGAPIVTWFSVERRNVDWTAGEPRAYRHRSDWPTPITRRFCGECGSALTYEREGSEQVDLTAATLDDPDAVSPAFHVYASRQIAWLHLGDGLPRYDKLRPDPA